LINQGAGPYKSRTTPRTNARQAAEAAWRISLRLRCPDYLTTKDTLAECERMPLTPLLLPVTVSVYEPAEPGAVITAIAEVVAPPPIWVLV